MTADDAKLLIIQRACIEMGAKIVTSLDDTSNVAEVILNIYDDCLREVLEEHPWSFSLHTVALEVATAGDPLAVVTPVDFGDGVSIAYARPDDFVSLYKLNFPSALFMQENIDGLDCILSNTSGLVIKYVFLNIDPLTYSAKFRLALALKIAATSCFKIAEAAQYAAGLQGRYDKALMTAMSDDAKGSVPDQPIQDNIFYEKTAGANTRLGVPGNSNNVGFF